MRKSQQFSKQDMPWQHGAGAASGGGRGRGGGGGGSGGRGGGWGEEDEEAGLLMLDESGVRGVRGAQQQQEAPSSSSRNPVRQQASRQQPAAPRQQARGMSMSRPKTIPCLPRSPFPQECVASR